MMKKLPKIWLSSPHMGGGEQEFIKSAFETNWVAPMGPNVNGFEEDLETYLDQNVYVCALSSGTAALHLALLLLGVKEGDEVLCQSMTFSASANPIVYLKAKPVFIDSDKDTWNICPHYLEVAIKDCISRGKKPKAIIAVHLYGMPFKADEIIGISKKYDIPIVEDSAEALGSSYKNQKCGTFGDIGILSFNGNKIITTSGGGALVAKENSIKAKALFYATQARENDVHYEHKEIGYNYRMSNICAGIGRGQMQVLDNHVRLRRQVHQFYEDQFKNRSGITVFNEPNSDFFSNNWISCITIDSIAANGLTREQLKELFDIENIETRPLWKPMHLQPVFENCLYFGEDVSENLFKTGLCLPSGSNLNEEEKERIKNIISNI